MPGGRLALMFVVAVATTASLLALTASARADTKDVAADVVDVDLPEQSSTTTETAPAPIADEAVSAPEPASAPAAESGPEETSEDTEGEPTAASAPTPPPTHSISTPPSHIPSFDATRTVSATVGSLSRAEPEIPAPPAGQVSELAGGIQRDIAKTAAQTVDQAVGQAVDGAVGQVHSLPQHPVQLASEALRRTMLNLLPANAAEGPPLLGAQSEVDLGTLLPAASELPKGLPAGFGPGERVTVPSDLLEQHPAQLADTEPMPRWMQSVAGDLSMVRASQPSGVGAGEYLGGHGDRSRSSGPLNDNSPPPSPGSPLTGASGWGVSSFAPIAALLALLALAVPAIRRRPREAPAFSVPTPFVCALERPG